MKSSPSQRKFNTSIVFNKDMIAPCGMNCGTCLGYMRHKDHCPGCRVATESKPAYCIHCIIINCERLKATTSGFCYECSKYPCLRLKRLDKRYRTRYQTSFFDNLKMIKVQGIERFLAFETERRTCPECGSTLCIHRTQCFQCGYKSNVAPRCSSL
jgi:hypothetical protein